MGNSLYRSPEGQQFLFVDPRQYTLQSYLLAEKIASDRRFVPDVMVTLWRGGTPVGIRVHEALKRAGISVDHVPLKVSRYKPEGESPRAEVGDLTYILQASAGKKMLVIDDVFDKGLSIQSFLDQVAQHSSRGMPDHRIATVHYKPGKNETRGKSLVPHYYIESLGDDVWIVYPHEMTEVPAAALAAGKPESADLLFGKGLFVPKTPLFVPMDNKIYLTDPMYMLESQKLAMDVIKSGFIPDLLIGLWRGGAEPALYMHEVFKAKGFKPDHIAVKTSRHPSPVEAVEPGDLEYLRNHAALGSKVLITEDVMRHGTHVKTLLNVLTSTETKIAAVVDASSSAEKKPDYCRITIDPRIRVVTPSQLTHVSWGHMRLHKGRDLAEIISRIEKTTA